MQSSSGACTSPTTRRPGTTLTFANNDGWHDDVSDWPVTATVTLRGRHLPVEHAWVVVAPPDYAPGVIAVTTLYDVIRDAGWRLDPSAVPRSRPSRTTSGRSSPGWRRINGSTRASERSGASAVLR